jgi:hypothetical protein
MTTADLQQHPASWSVWFVDEVATSNNRIERSTKVQGEHISQHSLGTLNVVEHRL